MIEEPRTAGGDGTGHAWAATRARFVHAGYGQRLVLTDDGRVTDGSRRWDPSLVDVHRYERHVEPHTMAASVIVAAVMTPAGGGVLVIPHELDLTAEQSATMSDLLGH